MNGARKAATVMLLLGEERSAPILKHLDEDEVKTLSLAMAELGTVPRDAANEVVNEFVSRLTDNDRVIGTYDRTEAFLRSVLPREKAEAIIDEIRGQASRNVWLKLSSVDASLLSAYLEGEHPQTAALILSRLPPAVAASAISTLSEDYASNVLHRMLSLNTVQRDALDSVEKVLHAEFLSGIARTARRDSHETLAEVFNALDRQTEKRLMSALERSNETAAARIKGLMFTFEDLTKLGAAGIQTILRFVDRNILAQALKGAPDEARDVFRQNMSTRAAKMLDDDIGALGPMRMKDVEAAQATLIQLAKDLEAKGELVIGRGAEDEFV